MWVNEKTSPLETKGLCWGVRGWKCVFQIWQKQTKKTHTHILKTSIMRPKYLGCPVMVMKVDTSAYLRLFLSNTLIWVNSFCLDSVLTKQYYHSHLTFLWAYEIDPKRWYLGLRYFWSNCFDPADFALCSKEIYIFTIIYIYIMFLS